MKDVWNWLMARLKEPSTWAGIAVAATAISSGLASGSDWTALVGGALAAVLSEKSSG